MTDYDKTYYDPPAPAARVAIQHPDDNRCVDDIPMQIDSGSDVTLIPQFAVQSLGIERTGDRQTLTGFDGTTLESEVVRVDLFVMGGRLRGSFPLIDAEVGILGRNVLNLVRLTLDGPALRWVVQPSKSKSS